MAVRSGKIADDVGATADLFIEPFLGVVRPNLAPDLFGERGERQQLGAGTIEVLGHLRKFVRQRVEHPIILGHNRFSVRLIEDRMQQGAHPRPGRLRGHRHQVGRVVGSAALPGRPGQGGTDYAATRPGWASLVTNPTPDKPRATRSRKNASHPAPSSAEDTATPRISR